MALTDPGPVFDRRTEEGRRIRPHTVNDEPMKSRRRPSMRSVEGFEYQKRFAESFRVGHGMLQAEGAVGAALRRHPVHNEIIRWQDGDVAHGRDTDRGGCSSHANR